MDVVKVTLPIIKFRPIISVKRVLASRHFKFGTQNDPNEYYYKCMIDNLNWVSLGHVASLNFGKYVTPSRETIQNNDVVTMEDNRKSYIAYRNVLLSMTLSDLDGR